MLKPENIYEGIYFHTQAGKYSVAITEGNHTNVVGHYDTLREAVQARREALNNQTRKHD